MNISIQALTLAILLFLFPTLTPQKITSLTAAAKGHGTFTVGDTTKEIHSIVVVLREGGDAQITLITDLQLSTQGRWTASDDPSQGIQLQITGGIVAGNQTGSGRLLLRDNGKDIASLTAESSSPTGGKLKIEFVADPKTGS